MANNRIKGLTVEIGGDTTQLGQALESVNKKSGDLSAELRDIERLLKFDPENTELLAQRQRVLADTVENTAQKLETLREAERQVQRQFERGEVSVEQVRALQREIIETEGRLNHYQTAAQEAADGTKDLGDEAEDTGSRFEGMGGKLANAAKAGIGAVITGATAAMGALVASAESTREYRTEMGKLTTAFETVGHRTEMAEEAYKRLYGVIGETDQAVEASQQIALLAESEEDVIKWADLGAGVVARFGDALQPEMFYESANETLHLGEATGAYVQLLEGAHYDVDKFNAGLAACTTESEKQAYMLKITDEILGDAADTYRETNEEVISANDANGAWMATMAEIGTVVDPVLTDVKMLGTAFVSDLVPGIKEVVSAFGGLINGEEGSAEKVGEALSALLTDLLDKAMALLPTVITTAMTLLTSLTSTLIGMLPELVQLGVMLLTAIMDGLAQLPPAITEMLPQLMQALVDGIPLIIDSAVQLLLAIMDAIPIILPILVEAIPGLVIAIVNALINATSTLFDGAIQLLLAVVDAIPVLLDALLPEIPTIVDTIVAGLIRLLPQLIDGAVKLLFGILEAFPEIVAAIYEEAPSIVTSIVEALIKLVPELIKAGGQLLAGLIKGMLDYDYMEALSKVGNGLIKGFKKIFDIKSPSRVMAGIGELLDEGLAVGIEEGAKAPVNALDKLSGDMLDSVGALNGVTVERSMTHNIGATASATDGIASKLDQIYKAILSGQVIMLDGKTLVGSTAVRYDNELGQRRVLAERGAL